MSCSALRDATILKIMVLSFQILGRVVNMAEGMTEDEISILLQFDRHHFSWCDDCLVPSANYSSTGIFLSTSFGFCFVWKLGGPTSCSLVSWFCTAIV